MNKQTSLQFILGISVVGILFSGYLSYQELFASGCSNTIIQCGSTFSFFTLPACVYGLGMYLVICIVSFLGLFRKGDE